MAWVTLDTDGLLADEPLTSPEVLALYENPIEMAEGAPGAPKVVSAALDMLVGAGDTTTVFIDLDRVDKVLISASAATDGGNAASVLYQLSTDNGSSFVGGVSLLNLQPTSDVPSQTVFTVVELGSSFNAIRIVTGASGNSVASFSILGVSGVKP